jgi:hypothetical protein
MARLGRPAAIQLMAIAVVLIFSTMVQYIRAPPRRDHTLR